MCTHFVQLELFKKLPIPRPRKANGELVDQHMWPRYYGGFVRRAPALEAGDEAVPQLDVQLGRWGLVSALTRPEKLQDALKLMTVNARTDRVVKSFTFGNAWRRAQHCIVPVEAIYEPDWRPAEETGKPVPTRFTRADGGPLGIAGLWDSWTDANGDRQLSYTMFTINADDHPLFKHMHRPHDEKRMVVILPEAQWDEWLDAPAVRSMEFMNPYPAERLVATTAPPLMSR
jgi:putative SOS response-associated peptidase YedK